MGGSLPTEAVIAKIKEGYSDCHDKAQAIPQQVLDKKMSTKYFGRQMMFFHCVKVSINIRKVRQYKRL